MQLQGRSDLGLNLPKFSSTFQCVQWTVQKEGVAGLYQGLGACLLKVMPAAAISFMIYESVFYCQLIIFLIFLDADS